MKHITNGQWALIIALLVIVLDQALKIWVKTGFYIGETREVLPFFDLTFVENNGMAFGWEFGSKMFLTLFRIVFVGLIIWFIWKLRNQTNLRRGYMICLALVLAGALGNIIDCMFYGLIFNDPAAPAVASFVPLGDGYASLMQGRVVDMLHFPLFSFYWPEWMPFVGGEFFEFFSPIFNLADAAITCGILAIIIFYRKQMSLSFADFKAIRKAEKEARKEAKEKTAEPKKKPGGAKDNDGQST